MTLFHQNKHKISLVFALLLFFLICIYFFNGLRRGIDETSVFFSNDWTVFIDGQVYEVDSLNDFIVPRQMMVGDTIVMKNTIPADKKDCEGISIQSYLSALEVKVGERVAYSYGLDLISQDKMVGSGTHYVSLSRDDVGKDLVIKVIVGSRAAFSSLPQIQFFSNSFFIIHTLNKYSMFLAIAIFLVFLGVLLLVCSIAIFNNQRLYYRLFLIGIQSMLLGVWTFCFMRGAQLFSLDYVVNTSVEFISLYLIPVPFILLVIEIRNKKIPQWKMDIMKGFLALFVLFNIMVIGLALAGVAYFAPFLSLYHICMAIVVIYVIGFKVVSINSKELGDRLFSIGLLSLIVMGFLDLIRYNVVRYFSVESEFVQVTFVPLGALLYLAFLVASYLVFLYHLITSKTENEILAKLAYRDNLTGLYSRSKGDQIFEALRKTDDDFAFVSIDLNGLKYVNDTYGHTQGDSFIVAFADILKKSFSGEASVVRVGGDEFLVIVRKEHLDKLDKALEKMEALEKEAVDLPQKLEASYGIAYRHEVVAAEGSDFLKEIYSLADSRMYEMKKRLKNGR